MAGKPVLPLDIFLVLMYSSSGPPPFLPVSVNNSFYCNSVSGIFMLCHVLFRSPIRRGLFVQDLFIFYNSFFWAGLDGTLGDERIGFSIS